MDLGADPDVRGFASIVSEQSDKADLREIVREFRRLASEAVFWQVLASSFSM
jgi:hypothetical protein